MELIVENQEDDVMRLMDAGCTDIKISCGEFTGTITIK